MHRLTRVDIENFRSCRECGVPLADYTPIVGYNNGGKSNIIDAIRWLLEGGPLAEGEFGDPSRVVVVTGIVEGITDTLLESLADRHRRRIEPRCIGGQLRIRRTQERPSRTKKDVDLDIWDPEAEEWIDNPAGIDQAISALFPAPLVVGAMENATEDVTRSKTTTTIGRLLAQITGPLEDTHGANLEKALHDIRVLLEADGSERAPELEEFDRAANEIVDQFFPGIRIALHLPPPEVTDLFKSGTLRVFEDGEEESRDIDALGHGAQRSLQMALVKYLAEVQAEGRAAGGRTLLLIDEPELYLHPQAIATVRAALKDLASSSYQVVFSTHSPQMVGISDVADTLIVRKSPDDGTHILPTVREAVHDVFEDAVSQVNTLFELSNAAQILFADRVILAEGKSDQRLLPPVADAIHDVPLDRSRTALVGVGSCNSIPGALRVLEVIGIPACAIVDLDFAFRGAVNTGVLERDGEEQAACRAIVAELATQHSFDLATDGFPRNSANLRAEDAFALLAARDDAGPWIAALHATLLEHRIWLWTKGSLEQHLGLDGKGEEHWGEFAAQLREGHAPELLADPDTVRGFFEWALA